MQHLNRLLVKTPGASIGPDGTPIPFLVSADAADNKGRRSTSAARPNALQARTGTLLSTRTFMANVGNGKRGLKGAVRLVIPRSVVREWHEELADEEAQMQRWAVPVPPDASGALSVQLIPQIWGTRKYSQALSMLYGGSLDNMRQDMLRKARYTLTSDRTLAVKFFSASDIAHLDPWRSMFPVIRVSDVHGYTWPASDQYAEKTEAEVGAVHVNEMHMSIPLHLRFPWNPSRGELGDAPFPELKAAADDAAIRFEKRKMGKFPAKRVDSVENADHLGFPLGLWISPAQNCASITKLLAAYQGPDGGQPGQARTIVHQAGVFVGDSYSVMAAKQEEDGVEEVGAGEPEKEKKLKMSINLLRMEDLGAGGSGTEGMDPNLHSRACFRICLDVWHDSLGTSGITRADEWESICRAYGPPPAYVWAVPKATESTGDMKNKQLLEMGKSLLLPFEASGRNPTNGTVYAKAIQICFVMGPFLLDNGIPVTREWAESRLTDERIAPTDTVYRPLSGQNNHGIACLTEWYSEDNQLALNAGVPGFPREDIHYRALVVSSEHLKKTCTKGKKNQAYTVGLSVRDLETLSALTPEQGTACMRGDAGALMDLSGENWLVYVYALTPEAMAMELSPAQITILGGADGDTSDGMLARTPAFTRPFRNTFGAEDDAAMLAMADAVEAKAAGIKSVVSAVVQFTEVVEPMETIVGGGGEGEDGEGEGEEADAEGEADGDAEAEEDAPPELVVGARRSRSRSKSPAPAAAKAGAKKKGRRG